ncbi:hypothetical protein MPSEU_000267800 [Mayamaea pseudoterrestris]|nr:hypothetical protein MPSEU_000267800 [Mayamaea pseudoterrestris]
MTDVTPSASISKSDGEDRLPNHPRVSSATNLNLSSTNLLNDDESVEGKDAHTDLLEFPSSIRGVMRSQSLQAMRRPTDSNNTTSTTGASLLSPLHRAATNAGNNVRMAPPARTRSSGGRLRRAPGRSLSSDDGPMFRRVGRTKSSNDAFGLVGFRRASSTLMEPHLSVGSGILLEKDRSRGLNRQASFESTWSCDSEMDSQLTTADSINLRKNQLIADPLDGGYSEGCSVADHESMYDNMSQWSREYYDEILEFLPEDQPIFDKDYMVMVGGGNPMEEGAVAYLTLDALKLRRPTLQVVTDQQCEVAALTARGGVSRDFSASSSSLASASETTEHLDDLDDTNEYDETNGEDNTDTTD